jgi:hypothetical protein
LHVVYENGTEVYVNRGAAGNWTVKDGSGNRVELPVSGWLAFHQAENFYELSANVGGRRIDHVQAREFEFLDGRGQWTQRGNLGASGSVALRPHGPGGWELIDIYGNDRIAFQAKGPGVLEAYDAGGASLGRVEVTSLTNGWWQFRPLPKGRRYVFAVR